MTMKSSSVFILSLFLFFLGSCGSTDSGGTDPVVLTYTLSTGSEPANSGIVIPGSGTYDENTAISLQAVPEEGFAFANWDGDMAGSENPAGLVMNSNKVITAVFEDIRSVYSVDVTFTDGIDQIALFFGQSETPGEQSGYAPPPPPEGALNAYFEYDDEKWYADFRPDLQTDITWELVYQTGEVNDITLQWAVAAGEVNGSLRMVNQETEVEIDMLEVNETTLSGPDPGRLTIRFQRETVN